MDGDYEWFVEKSRNGELAKYSGEWVIVIEKKVVAHGKNLGHILQKVKKEFPGKMPFLASVSEPGLSII